MALGQLWRLVALLSLAHAAGAGQDGPVLLRSLRAEGGTLAIDADLTLELGRADTEGSLRLERRTAIRDRHEAAGAVLRSFEALGMRVDTPHVEGDPVFLGRCLLEGRSVRFTPQSAPAEGTAEWTTRFADGRDADSDEAAALEHLSVETGLDGLVPGRAVTIGETYSIEPRVLARVLALGGGYSYGDEPVDGEYPFRVAGAGGEPLRARLASVRAVGDEHVAEIRIDGTVTVVAAFPGPGPLWRIGFASDDRVPRRARLQLEVEGRLEWWVEAGRADSLELEADLELTEELTRIGTICEDSGLPPLEREIPFDPDLHLLRSVTPEKAPRNGTLKLRLEADC